MNRKVEHYREKLAKAMAKGKTYVSKYDVEGFPIAF